MKGAQSQGVDIFDNSRPGESFDSGIPPTPPQKDTPPDKDTPFDDKENAGFAHIHPAYRTSAADEEEHKPQGLFADGGMRVQLPYLTTDAEPIPVEGGKSPSKFRPYRAEDYAKMINSEPIGSAHALFDYAPSNIQDYNADAPLDVELPAPKALGKERWGAGDHARYSNHLSQRTNERLRELPPAFYSPSSYSHSLFEEGNRPSQNVSASPPSFRCSRSVHIYTRSKV